MLELPTSVAEPHMRHVRSKGEGYQCKLCTFEISKMGQLARLLSHVSTEHGIMPPPRNPPPQQRGKGRPKRSAVRSLEEEWDASTLRDNLEKAKAEVKRLTAALEGGQTKKQSKPLSKVEAVAPQGASFGNRLHVCRLCQKPFDSRALFVRHVRHVHDPRAAGARRGQPLHYERVQRFRGNTILNYELSAPETSSGEAYWPGVENVFTEDNARDIIAYFLLLNTNISVQVGVQLLMKKPQGGEGVMDTFNSFHIMLERRRLFEHMLQPVRGKPAGTAIDQFLNEAKLEFQRRLSFLEETGSGWTLEGVQTCFVKIYDGTRLIDGHAGGKTQQSRVVSFLKETFVNHQRAFELPEGREGHCLLYAIAQYYKGGDFSSSPTLPEVQLRSRAESPLEAEEGEDLLEAFERTHRLILPADCSSSPLSIAYLKQLEDLNKESLNFRINVHLLDQEQQSVVPYMVSSKPMASVRHSIDLLLFELPPKGPSHYVLISDLGQMRLRKKGAKQVKTVGRSYVCRQCYRRFSTTKALLRHETGCFLPPKKPKRGKKKKKKEEEGEEEKEEEEEEEEDEDALTSGDQIVEMPERGDVRLFKAHEKTQSLPFFAVADFETCMSKGGSEINTDNREVIHHQKPVSYGLAFVNTYTEEIIFERHEASQENCMELFFSAIEDARELVDDLIHTHPKHSISPKESLRLRQEATHCYLCKGEFQNFEVDQQYWRYRKWEEEEARKRRPSFSPTKNKRRKKTEGKQTGRKKKGSKKEKKIDPNVRVIDHCHVRGVFLGVAHSSCNLRRQLRTRQCPIMIHNLANFDQCFIVNHLKALSKHEPSRLKRLRPTGLVKNTQRFRTINLASFKLVDSLAFINCSLDRAVKNLKAGGHDFPILKQSRLITSADSLEVATAKGVFCYEQLVDVEDFRQREELPSQADFYNALADKACSDEDYARAQKAFKAFQCKNMLDYLLAYQEMDILLLAEVIQTFRKVIQDAFGLELLHYISLPGLSFDAFLKMSGAKIELLSDPLLFKTIRGAIRGGLSFARERYVEATEDRQVAYVDGSKTVNLFECQTQAIFLFFLPP